MSCGRLEDSSVERGTGDAEAGGNAAHSIAKAEEKKEARSGE
jgi:hypothetical protein